MSRGKVLVVEDELPTAQAISRSLEQAGYEVAHALDGASALAMVGQQRPDLVLLDVLVPDVDGWQVLVNLRTNPTTEDIPVIMLTVLDEDHHVAKGWTLGTDCYLTKPFKPETLIAMVNRFMELDQPPSAMAS